jgi:hypothetical protein
MLSGTLLSAQFKDLIYKQDDKDARNGGANYRGRNPAGLVHVDCVK